MWRVWQGVCRACPGRSDWGSSPEWCGGDGGGGGRVDGDGAGGGSGGNHHTRAWAQTVTRWHTQLSYKHKVHIQVEGYNQEMN